MPDIPTVGVDAHYEPHSASTSGTSHHEDGRVTAPPMTLEDMGHDCMNAISTHLPLHDHLNLVNTSHFLHTTLQTKLHERVELLSDQLASEANVLFEASCNAALIQFIKETKLKISALPEELQHKVYHTILTKRRDASLRDRRHDWPMEKEFRKQTDEIISNPRKLAALSAGLSKFRVTDNLPSCFTP